MNKTAISALSLCLITSGALASENEDTRHNKQVQSTETQLSQEQPMALTDEQLDQVSGGLINVFLVDTVDIEDNEVIVAVPVNAAVAAGVLGNAVAGAAQRPGRITQ